MTYLNTHEIGTKLVAAIHQQQPLSLIRVGDGESMMLDGVRNPGAAALMAKVIRRQLGDGISMDDHLTIRKILIKALAAADIIGIPIGKKLDDPDSHWFRCQSLLVEHVPVLHKQFCDIDIHYHLTEQRSNFINDGYSWIDELFDAAPRIFYISCRNITRQLEQRTGKEIQSYHIAPEMMFTTYNGPAHWPKQYMGAADWMDQHADQIAGSLCLVGAGVVGKTYCNWFRDRGGIAIDMGSVFDKWAGHVTRGPERGRDKKTTDGIL